MDERKKIILRAVTDDYISTAEPVGSRTIARRYNLGVSPATIRNEMADLEESGYLEQPHTSAGRIPSHKGYRFYVDFLMESEPVSYSSTMVIRSELASKRVSLEEVIHRAAHMLSNMTRYTSVAIVPRLSRAAFRHIQFILLREKDVLVLLVTDPGFVRNRIVETHLAMSPQTVERLSEYLNDRLKGLTLSDITRTLLDEMKSEFPDEVLYEQSVELLTSALEADSAENLYLEGTMSLFDQPEFSDINRAKPLLNLLDQRESLYHLLSETHTGSGVNVTIGVENRVPEMRDCSLVTATYHVSGEVVGVIGILGPTRMEYGRAFSIVELVSDILSEVLSDTNSGK